MRLSLMCVFALAAWYAPAQPAAAQSVLQGRSTYGMFGPRTLGQPIAPRPGQWNGLQYGTSGNFMYRGQPDGSTSFAAPWRRVDAAQLAENPRYVAAYQAAQEQAAISASPLTLPANALPLQAPPALVLPPASDLGPATDTGTALAGEAAPAAPAPRDFRPQATAASLPPGATPAAPMLVSLPVSERVTRVARNNGMLVGERIEVSLGGNVARLAGAVRNPRDRHVLANVLGLEPGIQAIDNRLTVAGPAGAPAR